MIPNATILIVSLIISIPMTYLVIVISKQLGFLDKPQVEEHKVHKNPVPLAGGISLFFSINIILLLFRNRWDSLAVTSLPFLIGLVVIFLVGLFDDIFIFKPPVKMLGQIIGAALLVYSGISISLFQNSLANILLTLVWFVGIINAFNFLEGSDGMILESGIIISAVASIFSGMSGQNSLQSFSLALIGLLCGLLVFNFHPARMFMGDAGSQLVGVLLATVVLLYNPLGFDPTSSWITPILMMSIPIFDVTLVVISRIRRNIPVVSGGLDHTYHRLVKKGIPSRFATLLIVLMVLVTNSLAHLTLVIQRSYAYFVLGVAIMAGILAIYWLEKTYTAD
jgi:UDP-GlcNAc:undecaprenyl-phosphate GlcNAc-1-phosphate transferase